MLPLHLYAFYICYYLRSTQPLLSIASGSDVPISFFTLFVVIIGAVSIIVVRVLSRQSVAHEVDIEIVFRFHCID
jgi:hypothetical protein